MTTRVICGSLHGAWDDYGRYCIVCHPPTPDHRDAEIARLKAEVERFKRALAAGPAAVRKQAGRCKGSKRSECLIDAAEIVVAAQVAAMKGEK